jgi:hypothetical protein
LSIFNQFFPEILFDLLQLFLLIIHFLVLNVNFTPYHSDLLVTHFLLPVKVVQDFFALVELGLLFSLLFLLRLQIPICLSNLSLQSFYLFVLHDLFVFKLCLDLEYNCFIWFYVSFVCVNFCLNLLYYRLDVEFAVT